ncbi:DEAD/DEAH box helicase [Lactobacillus phage S16]|nr:DEAD/DEAH box helicase [Lactobacillus phage S16]
MQLRTYQIKLINDLKESLAKGNKNVMVQSPAGSGKSVTMAEIARKATKRRNFVLFIVHRRELVDQIKKTFKLQNVNFNFCYIGMVQTVTRHLDKINYPRRYL